MSTSIETELNKPATASLTLLAAIFVASLAPWSGARAAHSDDRSEYRAPKVDGPLTIDGVADESGWQRADWRPLAYRWLGPEYSEEDFQGRYKVVWTPEKLYVLGEFVDDVLWDAHRDSLVQYWDDDCLEIFLDEDFSGGEHRYNHNAFAYHMSLDNRAIDLGTDEKPHDYSHNVESRWKQHDGKIVWELAIDVHDDGYVDGSESNVPVTLAAGKILGFMVAYCDNDGEEFRENFIGSEQITDGATDRGYIDANVFGSLVLIE